MMHSSNEMTTDQPTRVTKSMPCLQHLGMDELQFLPVSIKPNNKSVEVQDSKGGRLKFQLANDEHPLVTCFPLDPVREDNADTTRRGLLCRINDAETLAALERLDQKVLSEAITNSKRWFKSAPPDDQVALRHKPLVIRNGDNPPSIRLKVKCQGAAVPTEMYLKVSDTELVPTTEVDLDCGNTEIVPIVSTNGVWIGFGDVQFGMVLYVEKLLILSKGMPRNPTDQFSLFRPMTLLTKARPPLFEDDPSEEPATKRQCGGVELVVED